MAPEAYGHYDSGDLSEAIDVAQHAQELVPTLPCVGADLAAALEAGAHAVMRNHEATAAALRRAEEITAQLDGDDRYAGRRRPAVLGPGVRPLRAGPDPNRSAACREGP